MSKRAKIYTYSIVYSAAENFRERTPYVVAVVEDETGRYLARIEGYDNNANIQIGMEVEALAADSETPLFKFI